MAHKVKCFYCGQVFDRDKYPYVQVKKNRYAHPSCAGTTSESEIIQPPEEDKDKLELEQYIMKLLNENYINPRVRKQLNQYVDEYNYTYSGMLKALIYFYEVKGNSLEKANGGVGIIPWIYKDAYNYYYNLWMIKQKNENKDISAYIPQVQEITIEIPKRKPYKRKLFSFLDEEEAVNGI